MPDATAVVDTPAATGAAVVPPVVDTPATPSAAATEVTPPAAEAKPADAKPAEVVYEFKAPEGVELDKGATAEFMAIAKDLKLAPEAAQKVVDIAVGMQQRAAEAHTTQVAKWADETRADKELGGDKLPQTLAVAARALALGPPELKQLLNDSGLGNHPAVVKWAHAIGKALSEDKFVSSTGGAAGMPNPALRLYDKSTMNP